jgi:DNA-binding NtrC family response regulator
MSNIENGEFREDLYYRLQVIVLHLPPLRERADEILPIATHYLQNYAQKFRKPLQGFSKAAENALREYSWPGNIRELINAVERAAILCRDAVVQPDDLGLRTETVSKPVRRSTEQKPAAKKPPAKKTARKTKK